MQKRLSSSDQFSLECYLRVPSLFRGGWRNSMMPDAAFEDLLSKQFAGLEPDGALIAIALCVETLSLGYKQASPEGNCVLKHLQNQSTEILDRYGPVWLRNAEHLSLGVKRPGLIRLLDRVPERLSRLADLLALYKVTIEKQDRARARLCSILSEHAALQSSAAKAHLSSAIARGYRGRIANQNLITRSVPRDF